jgi:hypothetical protein
MNESRTHKSFSIHSRSSSFYNLINVSKNFLLQLIASIIIKAIFCSLMLSYQLYWHQNWSESEACWSSFIERVIFVSRWSSSSHLFLSRSFNFFSSFFSSFFILFASYSQIKSYLSLSSTIVNWLFFSFQSFLDFFKRFEFFYEVSSSFMKNSISKHLINVSY